MEFTEIISEAISTLAVNKLRTALAVLGIVIGIGSVIALICFRPELSKISGNSD